MVEAISSVVKISGDDDAGQADRKPRRRRGFDCRGLALVCCSRRRPYPCRFYLGLIIRNEYEFLCISSCCTSDTFSVYNVLSIEVTLELPQLYFLTLMTVRIV